MGIIEDMRNAGRGGFRKIRTKLDDIKDGLETATSMVKGIFYCEPCLRKTIKKQSPDSQAFQKSMQSGIYERVTEGKCMICDKPAKYKVSLSNAQRAIKKAKGV